jgi:hypothetical protein
MAEYLSKSDLRKALSKKVGAPIDEEVWNKIQPGRDWQAPYGDHDLEELRIRWKASDRSAHTKDQLSECWAHSRFMSLARAEELKPLVESFRDDLFGQPEPPFADAEAMEIFINERHKAEGNPLPFGLSLSWIDPKRGGARHLSISQSGLLGAIQRAAGSLAAAYGCEEAQATNFLLTDEPPVEINTNGRLPGGDAGLAPR